MRGRPPHAQRSGCARNVCCISRDDADRSAARCGGLRQLARPAIGTTRSKGRFYNRRHLPLAMRLPG
ncbi:hypothetical protein CFB84_20635 [Burkholderia aenigmatica]|uniref:Uncharacterized protein n=1 Tax=Burkholderia aenigmatica TaxID=2015348 RepID=A0A228ING6_9BURK|nr:hypothetical protein CFB84_20635 [Burkholderia aenigmatica]